MTSLDLMMAGEKADTLIRNEVAVQDKMWGDANERADATRNQLVHAGIAQLNLEACLAAGMSQEDALATAQPLYPPDWNGFRSYGSKVANLVVAAAYIRSEIKRLIILGEDTTRTARGEPYKGPDFPNLSSAEAIAQVERDAPPMHHPV